MRSEITFLLYSSIFLSFLISFSAGEHFYNMTLHPDFNNDPENEENTLRAFEVFIHQSEGKIFRGLFGSGTCRIYIKDQNRINEVEDGAFCATSEVISSIRIYNNTDFPDIESEMFANCSSLVEVGFQNLSISDLNIFRNYPKLVEVDLLSVKFLNVSDEIPPGIFEGLNTTSVNLMDLTPKKLSDDLFTSSRFDLLLIGSYDAQNPAILSENTLKNANGVSTLVLINANLNNVSWSRMERLYELIIDGPLHDTHHGKKVFFKNVKDNFPHMGRIRLNPKYYTKNERTFVERRLKKHGIYLHWSDESGYF